MMLARIGMMLEAALFSSETPPDIRSWMPWLPVEDADEKVDEEGDAWIRGNMLSRAA